MNKVKKANKEPQNDGSTNIYTVPMLAEKLSLSEETIRKYYRAEKLKGYKVAKRIFFLHSDVIVFIKSGD